MDTELYVNKTRGFTTIGNNFLNDPRISLKETAIYIYLRSKPTGWDFAVQRIAQDFPEGTKSIYAGMLQLEEMGLLQRRKHSSGKVAYTLLEYESAISQLQEKPSSPDGYQPNRLPAQSATLSKKEKNSKKEKKERKKQNSENAIAATLPLIADEFDGTQEKELCQLYGKWTHSQKLATTKAPKVVNAIKAINNLRTSAHLTLSKIGEVATEYMLMYPTYRKDKYTPIARSITMFCSKFIMIESWLERIQRDKATKQPAKLEFPPRTKKLLESIQTTMDWSPKALANIPQAFADSIQNHKTFRAEVKELRDKHTGKRDSIGVGCKAMLLYETTHNSIECWFRIISAKRANWQEWSGNFSKDIWSPFHADVHKEWEESPNVYHTKKIVSKLAADNYR